MSIAPHNQDAKRPSDLRRWPLAIITDLFYGSAVLTRWGGPLIKQLLGANTSYYDFDNGEGDEVANDGDAASPGPNGSTQPITQTDAMESRAERHASRTAQTTQMQRALQGVLFMWDQSAPTLREIPPSTHQADHSRAKVEGWLQQTQ